MTSLNLYREKLAFRLVQVIHIILLVLSLLVIVLLTQQNIPRKSTIPNFDLVGAKQAGYSDLEIDEYIDSKTKYNINWTGDWRSFLSPVLLSSGWCYLFLGLFRETILYILYGKEIKGGEILRFWGK